VAFKACRSPTLWPIAIVGSISLGPAWLGPVVDCGNTRPVTVDPQHSYQGAGLLLYRDSENYVRLERGFGSQGAIAFEYATDGRHTKIHGPFSKGPDPVPTSATVVWLRLVRAGTSIKGFWHPANTTTWQELSGTAPLGGDAKAGVAVLNRSQPPAGDPARKPLTTTFAHINVTC
jgi:hypothetical protein